jgi:hypothetical protein
MRFNLIGYNSSPRYRPHADTARKFHDYSCTILIVIFNGLGFFVAHSAFPDIFKWEFYPILVIWSWEVYHYTWSCVLPCGLIGSVPLLLRRQCHRTRPPDDPAHAYP